MADQRPLLVLLFLVRVVVAAVACVALAISCCANNLLYHIHNDN